MMEKARSEFWSPWYYHPFALFFFLKCKVLFLTSSTSPHPPICSGRIIDSSSVFITMLNSVYYPIVLVWHLNLGILKSWYACSIAIVPCHPCRIHLQSMLQISSYWNWIDQLLFWIQGKENFPILINHGNYLLQGEERMPYTKGLQIEPCIFLWQIY